MMPKNKNSSVGVEVYFNKMKESLSQADSNIGEIFTSQTINDDFPVYLEIKKTIGMINDRLEKLNALIYKSNKNLEDYNLLEENALSNKKLLDALVNHVSGKSKQSRNPQLLIDILHQLNELKSQWDSNAKKFVGECQIRRESLNPKNFMETETRDLVHSIEAIETKNQDIKKLLIKNIQDINMNDNLRTEEKFLAIGMQMANAYGMVKKNDGFPAVSRFSAEIIRLFGNSKLPIKRDECQLSIGEHLLHFLKPIINNPVWEEKHNNPKGIQEMRAILMSNVPVEEKLKKIVDKAITIQNKNPYNPSLFHSDMHKGRTEATQKLYDFLAEMSPNSFDKFVDILHNSARIENSSSFSKK